MVCLIADLPNVVNPLLSVGRNVACFSEVVNIADKALAFIGPFGHSHMHENLSATKNSRSVGTHGSTIASFIVQIKHGLFIDSTDVISGSDIRSLGAGSDK